MLLVIDHAVDAAGSADNDLDTGLELELMDVVDRLLFDAREHVDFQGMTDGADGLLNLKTKIL